MWIHMSSLSDDFLSRPAPTVPATVSSRMRTSSVADPAPTSGSVSHGRLPRRTHLHPGGLEHDYTSGSVHSLKPHKTGAKNAGTRNPRPGLAVSFPHPPPLATARSCSARPFLPPTTGPLATAVTCRTGPVRPSPLTPPPAPGPRTLATAVTCSTSSDVQSPLPPPPAPPAPGPLAPAAARRARLRAQAPGQVTRGRRHGRKPRFRHSVNDQSHRSPSSSLSSLPAVEEVNDGKNTMHPADAVCPVTSI